MLDIKNPYRPGAGSTPPYLAGREQEVIRFTTLLKQEVILENVIITGLRGVGKTVLLESLEPIARSQNWRWVANDLSESTSVSEQNIAIRLITDLAIITAGYKVVYQDQPIGFQTGLSTGQQELSYQFLMSIFQNAPGMISDKLEAVVDFVWPYLDRDLSGVVFAYDEAQTMMDHDGEKQYPLSLLLGFFQRIQRKNVRFMLILTGLPTLMTKLVQCRTYSERLFTKMTLSHLSPEESRDAIIIPVQDIEAQQDISLFSEDVVTTIIEASGGYPYFIQFICRETFDVTLRRFMQGEEPVVPLEAIIKKLDEDFFSGRWGLLTDRQKEMLLIIASMNTKEFSPNSVVLDSKKSPYKDFSQSNANQVLADLEARGMVYRSGRGIYKFAVPMLKEFILRNYAEQNVSYD